MRRLSLIGLVTGIVLIAFAIINAMLGSPRFVVVWLAGIGALALIGTVFERVRYKAVAPAPPLGLGWVETSEKFRDPATGGWVQVYFKPETGERRYVDIPPPTS
jgi:hypothetical protein